MSYFYSALRTICLGCIMAMNISMQAHAADSSVTPTTASTPTTTSITKPYILASIAPLTLVISDLLGEKAQVASLIKGHASAHHFSLTVSDKRKLQQADSVIWIGPSLEQFLTKSIDARTQLNKHNLSALALLDIEHTLQNAPSHHHHGHSHDEANDPHIWTSPILIKALYNKLGHALSLKYPHLASDITRNQKKAIHRLDATYIKGQAVFEKTGRTQPFYVYHNALEHFTHAFNLMNPLAFTQVPNESITGKQLKLFYKHAKSARCLIHGIDKKEKATAYARKLNIKTQAIDLLATETYLSYPDYLTRLYTDIAQCFQ